jgi:PKHD-type hydroxylase
MRQLWQMWNGSAPPEMLEYVQELADKAEAKEAGVFSGNNPDKTVRSSTVKWLHDQKLRDLLFEYVKSANLAAFSFDVHNLAEMQYTEYHAEEGGHYDWHHDIHWGSDKACDRKISITIQLSDPEEYEGGTFEFSECENPMAKNKGTVLVFPSYLQHRVLPVTKGVRKSLVAWFFGPRWR